MGTREWAAAKMLLDQSKVDGGGGGKDWINSFKRDDVGQENWGLPLGRETVVVCEITRELGLWELQD